MNDLSGPVTLLLMSAPILLLGFMRQRPVLRTAIFLVLLIPGFAMRWVDTDVRLATIYAALAWTIACMALLRATFIAARSAPPARHKRPDNPSLSL